MLPSARGRLEEVGQVGLKLALLTCSGGARVTATSLFFLEVFGVPTLFSLNYLPNWYKSPARSDVMLDLCLVRWALSSISLLLFLLLFHVTHVIHPRSSRFDPPRWGFWGPWVFWRCPLLEAIETCAARLCLHTCSVGLNPETSMALTKAVPSARQSFRPKRALTSTCIEVTFKCRLLWSFPSPCFGRFYLHVAVALAWLLHRLYACAGVLTL